MGLGLKKVSEGPLEAVLSCGRREGEPVSFQGAVLWKQRWPRLLYLALRPGLCA